MVFQLRKQNKKLFSTVENLTPVAQSPFGKVRPKVGGAFKLSGNSNDAHPAERRPSIQSQMSGKADFSSILDDPEEEEDNDEEDEDQQTTITKSTNWRDRIKFNVANKKKQNQQQPPEEDEPSSTSFFDRRERELEAIGNIGLGQNHALRSDEKKDKKKRRKSKRKSSKKNSKEKHPLEDSYGPNDLVFGAAGRGGSNSSRRLHGSSQAVGGGSSRRFDSSGQAADGFRPSYRTTTTTANVAVVDTITEGDDETLSHFPETDTVDDNDDNATNYGYNDDDDNFQPQSPQQRHSLQNKLQQQQGSPHNNRKRREGLWSNSLPPTNTKSHPSNAPPRRASNHVMGLVDHGDWTDLGQQVHACLSPEIKSPDRRVRRFTVPEDCASSSSDDDSDGGGGAFHKSTSSGMPLCCELFSDDDDSDASGGGSGNGGAVSDDEDGQWFRKGYSSLRDLTAGPNLLQVTNLIKETMPNELNKVPKLMRKFRGREKELLQSLQQMQQRSPNKRQNRACLHKSRAIQERRNLPKMKRLDAMATVAAATTIDDKTLAVRPEYVHDDDDDYTRQTSAYTTRSHDSYSDDGSYTYVRRYDDDEESGSEEYSSGSSGRGSSGSEEDSNSYDDDEESSSSYSSSRDDADSYCSDEGSEQSESEYESEEEESSNNEAQSIWSDDNWNSQF